jgi:hypothetical protein
MRRVLPAALFGLLLLAVPTSAQPEPLCPLATLAPAQLEGVDQYVVVGQPQPCPPPNRTRQDFLVTTDYGDGMSEETPFRDSDPLWSVGGRHTYRRAGTYELIGTVTDRQTGEQDVLRRTIQVPNAPLTARRFRPAAFLARHRLRRTVGRFHDGNRLAAASDHKARISWGDGSRSRGAVVQRDGDFLVLGAHRYPRAGPRKITVLVRDDRGATLRLRTTARVGR